MLSRGAATSLGHRDDWSWLPLALVVSFVRWTASHVRPSAPLAFGRPRIRPAAVAGRAVGWWTVVVVLGFVCAGLCPSLDPGAEGPWVGGRHCAAVPDCCHPRCPRAAWLRLSHNLGTTLKHVLGSICLSGRCGQNFVFRTVPEKYTKVELKY